MNIFNYYVELLKECRTFYSACKVYAHILADEELTKAMALVTSLTDDLKNSTDELLKMTSAFEEKTKALDMLNANVNAHAEELPTLEEGLAKCASPSEKVAFLNSGRYISVK